MWVLSDRGRGRLCVMHNRWRVIALGAGNATGSMSEWSWRTREHQWPAKILLNYRSPSWLHALTLSPTVLASRASERLLDTQTFKKHPSGHPIFFEDFLKINVNLKHITVCEGPESSSSLLRYCNYWSPWLHSHFNVGGSLCGIWLVLLQDSCGIMVLL